MERGSEATRAGNETGSGIRSTTIEEGSEVNWTGDEAGSGAGSTIARGGPRRPGQWWEQSVVLDQPPLEGDLGQPGQA
jgi:hypothetical protein